MGRHTVTFKVVELNLGVMSPKTKTIPLSN